MRIATLHRAALMWLFVILPGCDRPYDPDYTPAIEILAEGSGEAFGADLFPLEDGAVRTYVTPSGYVQQQVVGSATFLEAEVQRARTIDPAKSLDSFYRVDDAGVWDCGSDQFIYASPVPRLLFPVKLGKRWSMENADARIRMVAEVEGLETIGTAAGLFDAVRVSYTIHDTHLEREVSNDTIWFAPGTGIVKRTGYESYRNENRQYRYENQAAQWSMIAYEWLLLHSSRGTESARGLEERR